MNGTKEKADATANSTRPAKKNPYDKYHTILSSYFQERYFRCNGTILRTINLSNINLLPVETITRQHHDFGIGALEVFQSIGFLCGRGYLSMEQAGREAKVHMTEKGIRVLSGGIQDDKVLL